MIWNLGGETRCYFNEKNNIFFYIFKYFKGIILKINFKKYKKYYITIKKNTL